MPKKTRGLPHSELQEEQLKILNLIYQELQKLNSNFPGSAGAPKADGTSGIEDGSDEELDSYE